jgi:DNA modification methylase
VEVKDRIKELRRVKASELLPNPKNWRSHPVNQQDALRGLLAEIGFADALIARETPDGLMLIDGHLRAETMAEGMVPVLVLDVTEQEADKILATLDPLASMAVRDSSALESLIENIQTESDAVAGLLAATIDQEYPVLDFVAGKEKPPPRDDDEYLDGLTERVGDGICEIGDVWELGKHRLVCGDTFDDSVRDTLMNGQTASMIWCDPPYAIYGSASGLSGEVTDDKLVRPFFRDVLKNSVLAIDWFGHIYICCDWRSWGSWWEVSKQTDAVPKNMLVWDKGNQGMGNNYSNTYELVGFYHKMPERTVMQSDNIVTGTRGVLRPNMIRADRVLGKERQHNAAKPIDLISECLTNSSDVGDIVVDWFAGSGSTLLACEQMDRICYTVDIDPHWCDVTIQRWEEYTGQKAKKL